MKSDIEQGKKDFRARRYPQAFEAFSHTIGKIEAEEAGQWMGAEDLAELYLLRGAALLGQNEKEAYEDPDIFNQIIDDLDQAVELQSTQIEALLLRGRMYLNCQFADYQEDARKDFQEVLAMDKENLEALNFMGQLFYEQAEYDKSIYYFTHVLNQTASAEARELRALAYFRKIPPDYAAAAQDFAEAKKLHPEREEYYIWRSQCFQELGLVEDAIQEYNDLLLQNPGNAAYWVDRGSLYMQVNEAQALADFNRALEIQPDPLAYNNRAYYFRLKGQYDKAIEDAQLALEQDPELGIAYATLAEIYADMDEPELFYLNLSQALELYYEDVVDAKSEPAFQKYGNEKRFLDLLQEAKIKQAKRNDTVEN